MSFPGLPALAPGLLDTRPTQEPINRIRLERDLARSDRDVFQAAETERTTFSPPSSRCLDGQETYEVRFATFAAFLTALERHCGDPVGEYTASVFLDRLEQGNWKFDSYYADFQELIDVLDHIYDTSRRHALATGLSNR